MIAENLHTIARALATLAAETTDDHPVDPFALAVIARQIEAQADMLAEGLEG